MRRATGTTFLLVYLVSLCHVKPLVAATISVNVNEAHGPVNPLVFGNAQPFGHGDLLLEPDTYTFNAQALTLAMVLKPTVMRFPGGHADEYFWVDGIGPHHLRPEPRPGQFETFGFDYGTDEHMNLCAEIGAEAFITVNYGSGIVGDSLLMGASLSQRVGRAADWVEYCNAPNDGSNPNGGIDWAARRAELGHPEPYGVRFWEIGNEVNLRQFVGYPGPIEAEVETYAKNFIDFSVAMKAVDADIKIGAVGSIGPHWRSPWSESSSEWNATLLQIASEHIDFLVVHAHYPGTWDLPDNPEDFYRAGLAGANQALIDLTEIRMIIDREVDSSIGILPGENGLYGGEQNYQLATSLLASLHLADLWMLFLEQSSILNIPFACGWLLHSLTYSGDIAYQFSPIRRFARPEYYAQLMFREHFGDVLVANSVDCSTFSTVQVAKVQAMDAVPELSVCTSIDSTEANLYLIVINKQLDQDVETTIQVEGFEPYAEAHIWTLNGPSITAHNEEDPSTVTIVPSIFEPVSTCFTYTFPAHSLTAMELRPAAGITSHPMPSHCRLWQNFPNPFNGVTNIRYHLSQGAPVAIRIYNLMGQLVKTLVEECHPSGEHQAIWDATDDQGKRVASGVYFCRLVAGDFRETRKMVLLR